MIFDFFEVGDKDLFCLSTRRPQEAERLLCPLISEVNENIDMFKYYFLLSVLVLFC
jgi:hypothetical protein